MTHPEQAVVTGAFGYTGRYVARRLLDDGVRVRTLTRNPDREDPFAGQVQAHPLDFSDPGGLRRSMAGAGVLYNTYWIRFGRGWNTFEQAVENSRTLFEAAAEAGVGRIVHFSVTNASPASRLPYYRGKGRMEEILKGMGVPYAIIRSTLVFGGGDLLLNNLAWALRRFPIFPVFGKGDHPVRPVCAEDLASQAVEVGSRSENVITDAAGPEAPLLRGADSPAGGGDRRPGPAGAYAAVCGLPRDPVGRPSVAGRRAHPRRDRRVDGRTPHVGDHADRD